MKIQRTNISHFFHFNLKSALPIFMDENTSVASFPYFFNFNLKSALPIFIDENTEHFLHLIGRKIASYLFSLYLGTNLLHFPFFHFNLGSALPLFIHENTKNMHEITSFLVFLSYWA